MTSLQNFSVPLGNGTRKHLMQPSYRYRFRVTGCPDEITTNMVNVIFDDIAKTISMWVRVTVEPASMQDALDFGSYKNFVVEHMDGVNTSGIYSVKPTNLKLIQHTFELDYADSRPVTHHYVWSYDTLDLYVPESKVPENQLPPAEPGFLTPEEVINKLTIGAESVKAVDEDIGDPRTAGC